MSRLRVAVIGTGTISRLRRVPGCIAAGAEIFGLCHLRRERSVAMAAELRLDCTTRTDLLEMLETKRPDAVSVRLPNWLHEGPVLAALELGAHVLCEKPLAQTVQAALRLFEQARKRGRVPVVAPNDRPHSREPQLYDLEMSLPAGARTPNGAWRGPHLSATLESVRDRRNRYALRAVRQRGSAAQRGNVRA